MCMGLIDYYSERHEQITLFVRSDAKDCMEFYLRGKDNVEAVYFNSDDGRYYGAIAKTPHVDSFIYTSSDKDGHGNLLLPQDMTMQTHGEHDKWREDEFALRWYHYFITNRILPGHDRFPYFPEAFYEYYNIPYVCRCSSFNVNRDIELENKVYEDFVKEHGEDYILYHDDQDREPEGGVAGVPYRNTKINFDTVKDGVSYVNLNGRSRLVFDYIKVLENAQELHLIDSLWACLVYQLQARYNMFSDKPVNIYCQRGHHEIFQRPVQFKEWNLV